MRQFRRREEAVKAIRYDGTKRCAEEIVREIPGTRAKGSLVLMPMHDNQNPRLILTASPHPGDWVVGVTPGPMVVPAALFRVFFEEDLPQRGPLAPGAAERRAAGARAERDRTTTKASPLAADDSIAPGRPGAMTSPGIPNDLDRGGRPAYATELEALARRTNRLNRPPAALPRRGSRPKVKAKAVAKGGTKSVTKTTAPTAAPSGGRRS